jgi:hypothetical protein
MAVTSPDMTRRGTIRLTAEERVPLRDRALECANEARQRKAAVRRRLRGASRADSARDAAGIIRDPGDVAAMEAGELLLSVRKMGKATARPILARWNVSVWCPLGEMTARQRTAVALDLEEFAMGARRPMSETLRLILACVADADEMGVTCRDLNDRIGIIPQRSGPQLHVLTVRGLVSKERLTSRASLWLVTAAGRREVDRPQPIWGAQ